MALKKCDHCEREIAQDVLKCPQCGGTQKAAQSRRALKQCGCLAVIGFVVLVFLGLLMGL